MDDTDLILRNQHYLERAVERTGGAELDFALQLYQDPALLMAVLAEATLPPSASRVALGLDPNGNDGPWLVVTRSGEFVTVLGKGMQPSNGHPLPASQVASLMARALRQRELLAHADAVVPQSRRQTFLNRFMRHGSEITREDYRLFVAWLPVMYDTYKASTAGAVEFMEFMLSDPQTWLRMPPKRSAPHLRRLSESLWTASALLPVLAYEGRRHDWLEQCGAEVFNRVQKGRTVDGQVAPVALLPALMTVDGHVGPALRAAWAVGRIGKPLLPVWKQAFRDANGLGAYFSALFGLVTMAFRFEGLRAEVFKLLTSRQPLAKWPPELVRLHGEVAVKMELILKNEHILLDQHLLVCRNFAFKIMQRIGGKLALRYPTPDAISDDICRMLGVYIPGDFRDGTLFGLMIGSCYWLARVEAEALFPPAELMELWRVPWELEHGYELLRRRMRDEPVQQPVRAEPKQGRNERCNCGSGRKFKVCCASKEPTSA